MNENVVTDEVCEQYKALIWKFARQYWPLLPSSSQSFYDLDDMVGELYVHAIWVLSVRYDPAKQVRKITFLHQCLHNYCRGLLTHHYAKQRVGFPVDAGVVFPQLRSPDMERRRVEVIAAVERLLEDASDDLRQTFSEWLWEGSRRISKVCAREMQGLCRRHSVGADDLRLVLSII